MGYQNFGSTNPSRDPIYANILKNKNAYKGAKQRSTQSELAKKKLFQLFDSRFSNPNLNTKQKSSYIQFAKYIIDNPHLISSHLISSHLISSHLISSHLITDTDNQPILRNVQAWFSDTKYVANLCGSHANPKKASVN